MKILSILDSKYFGNDLEAAALRAAPCSDMLWFRVKEGSDGQIYEKAVWLRKLLPESVLILSERADIALCAGFDGVHLNADCPSPDAVKAAFPGLLVGYSAHSAAECREVPADYHSLSSIFESRKLKGREPLGALPAPGGNIYALGGVSRDRLPALHGLGYAGVAGISFIDEIEEIHKIINQR